MTKILESNELYENIIDELKDTINKNKISPKIALIRFGENKADLAYEKGIINSSEKLGIEVDRRILPIDVEEDEVLNLIENINNDTSIGGILIFRPIPNHLNEDVINQCISPEKDIDCMNPINKAKVYSGDISGFIPLAPKAAIKLVEYYGYDLKGKDCVIINHSNVVGKPLAMILLEKWATVTICHVETKNLREKTKNADFVFTAMGRAEMLDASYFNENSVVIDIGLSLNSVGKMRGDLCSEKIEGKISAYSPVPRGVGKITNLLLLENVVNYYIKKI